MNSSRKEKVEEIINRLKESSDDALDQVEHVLSSLEKSKKSGGLHYMGHFVGVERLSDNRFIMNLGLHNENTYGVAQGGALYTFADVTIGYTILSELPRDEEVYTLELKINFVKPGKGECLIAKPEILHWGRKVVMSQCSILDEEEEIVAQALGSFYIKKKR